jgi:anthranilate synthase component I
MITLPQQGTWLPADTQTPISLYLTLVREKQGFLLESTEVDGRLGRYSLIGWDYRMILSCVDGKLDVQSYDPRLHALKEFSGQDYVDGLRACLSALTVTGPENLGPLPAVTRSVCGYMAYNMGGIFEPALADRLRPEEGRSIMVLPGKVILFDHLHHRCCYLTLDSTTNLNGCQRPSTPAPPVVGAITTTPSQDEFLRRVGRAKDLITEGEAIQIVLSTRFSAPFSGSAFELYRRLRQINPSPYTFFMSFGELTVMGSSPELLIRCEDGLLAAAPNSRDPRTRPVPGTPGRPQGTGRARHARRPRTQRSGEDRQAGERRGGQVHAGRALLARHAPDLLPLGAAHGRHRCGGRPSGRIPRGHRVRRSQDQGHGDHRRTRGQSTGAPMPGAIGWLGLDAGSVNLDTGIAIRSLWIENGTVHWQAGAGIVYDSEPLNEWNECQNKARVIAETLRSPGGGDDIDSRQP